MGVIEGVQLHPMIKNLGQTDDGYQELGVSDSKIIAQGFTTGSNSDGYRLRAVGVNIEGSNSGLGRSDS